MNEEVPNEKLLLDEIERYVAHRTIGLLDLSSERSRSYGTATLIKINDSVGLLTCAHVADKFQELPTTGIVMFGQTHGKQKQFTKVSPEHCKITKVSTSNYSEFGPDLAFVEIPAPFAASLQAKLSTVDWLLESQKGLNSEPTQKKISGLMGMMEALDNSEPTKVTETEKIFTHQARINLGAVTECMNNFANYDLFDFTIHVNEREAPLPSFGGTSGGPVWRFFIEKDDAGILSIKESRLLGIAFWEHGTGPPVIRCHGPRSIHQILLNKVQQRVC